MMDQRDCLSDFRKMLECGICLNVVCNPKQLICGHTFCKSCLDKILQFDVWGAASIKCPNGCDKVTKITEKQTTNDLQENFMLKSASDYVVEENSKDHEKRRCSLCSRDAVRYCTSCDSNHFKCSECDDPHDAVDKDNFSDPFQAVNFRSSSDNNGVLFCREHMAEAVDLCCETKLMCTYCVHRGVHKNHERQSLDEVEEILRCVLRQRINVNTDYETRKEEGRDQINVAEESLLKVLRMKIVGRLVEYKEYLDKEEVRIKSEFRKFGQEYLKSFDSIAHFKGILKHEKLELLLGRKEVEKRLKTIYLESEGTIPGVMVSLVEDTSVESHPLGTLKKSHCKNELCKSFQGRFDTPERKPASSVGLLVDSLMKFAGDGSEYQVKATEKASEEKPAVNDDKENETMDVDVSDSDDVEQDENNNEDELKSDAGEMVVHKCQYERLPNSAIENILRTIDFSFTVQNVTKIHEDYVTEPVLMQHFKFNFCFGPYYHTTENGMKIKYAKACLYAEKIRPDKDWAITCDLKLTLKSKVGSGKTNSFTESRTFTELCSDWGWGTFINWADMVDEKKGYLEDDSVTFHAVIKGKNFK